MTDNPYKRWLADDYTHCIPIVTGDDLIAPFEAAMLQAARRLGIGPRPETFMDLEQIQIADYGVFSGVSASQRALIAQRQAETPIQPEEMLFLALRSLYQFAWPEPESEHDIRFAAAVDHALNQTLIGKALELAGGLKAPDALMPYWGRLAFLRVMSDLPTENVERFGLDRVACTLVKKSKFNATTRTLDQGSLIAMNYALQPILKHLNRYLLHFFGTRQMAGPNRFDRAWNCISATVLHFWSDVPTPRITQPTLTIYGKDLAALTHELSTCQLDFIVAHELGHVALDHPRRLMAEVGASPETTTLRHEFEFAADNFALGFLRSRLVDGVRARLQPPGPAGPPQDRLDDLWEGLEIYQRAVGSTYLLFLYMDFIQRAGELLRDRLGSQLPIRPRMDSHPRARQRLDRLELSNLGERLYTSPLQRYAEGFLQSVLDYAASLDDARLLASVSFS